MNISQWKNGDRTFFSLEVDDRLLLMIRSAEKPGAFPTHGSLFIVREREVFAMREIEIIKISASGFYNTYYNNML